jgi:hypothetical protein
MKTGLKVIDKQNVETEGRIVNLTKKINRGQI